MTPGAVLTNKIREAASKIGARLFVMSSGTFWQGRIVGQTEKTITLEYPKRYIIGFEGLSDLIGGSPVTITSEMVGQTMMVMTAIEVKSANDRPSKEQVNFNDRVRQWGGRAGFARSVEDGLKICRGE